MLQVLKTQGAFCRFYTHSKNAVIQEVIYDVSFPFKKLFVNDR